MSASTLDLEEVERGLAGTAFAGTLRALAQVGSTNQIALEAAQAGVQTGVWVADEQTAGRGRAGHSWHSVAGDGLYVSVLMRPKLIGADVLKLSLAAGVAAAQAIERATGARITLRWPNDLMEGLAGMGGKKLGGILTETAMDGGDGKLSHAVIGIGINLQHRAMPEGLSELATSLRLAWFNDGSSTQDLRREVVLPALLRQLEWEVNLLEQEAAGVRLEEGIAARFANWSPMVRGMHVRVEEEGGYTGVTDGLDAHGLLRVRTGDGATRVVRHGGVRPV